MLCGMIRYPATQRRSLSLIGAFTLTADTARAIICVSVLGEVPQRGSMRLVKGCCILLAFTGLASCQSLPNLDQLTLDLSSYSYPVMLSTVADHGNLLFFPFESGWSSTVIQSSTHKEDATNPATSTTISQNIGSPLSQQISAGTSRVRPDWILLASVRIRAMFRSTWVSDTEDYRIQVEVAAPTGAGKDQAPVMNNR